MTINLDTLRTVVENAGEAWADGEHTDIITPAVVLELIAEIESLRTRFKGMRAGRDSERSRADVNANALERMEQRALGAEANLEAALNVSRDRLSRLEEAEQQVQAVLRLADDWETGALRWEDPLRVPKEVFLLRKALQQPPHEPDWTDYQLGDPGASCSCGYNGPYKECWQSRRALEGDGRG